MVLVPKRRNLKSFWGLPGAHALLKATDISITTGLQSSSVLQLGWQAPAGGRQRAASVERYLGLEPPLAGGRRQRSSYSLLPEISRVQSQSSEESGAPSPTSPFILHPVRGGGGKGVGRWFVLLCFFFSSFFFSLKFILSFLSYFPPTRDLSTSLPAQPPVRKRGSKPRGFLGETPPTARNPSPGSPSAQLRSPAALTLAPCGPRAPPPDGGSGSGEEAPSGRRAPSRGGGTLLCLCPRLHTPLRAMPT